MDYCTQGNHVIAPGTEGVVVRQGARYCPEHVPPEFIQEPEPTPEPTPEPKRYVPTLRQQRHLEFTRWRYQQGDMAGDDVAEPLTDDEIDRLARHVLP